MATMSIGKAWEEAVAFVAREGSLLFPVALLFVALPGLILQEMTPPELAKWNLSETTMPQVPGSFWLAMMLAVVIIWFGSLRSEEHTSELQSLMRISYAVFCLKQKNTKKILH